MGFFGVDPAGKFLSGLGDAAKDYLDPENHFQADPTKVDPNAYQWGGQAGGAQADIDRVHGKEDQIDARKAPSVYSAGYTSDRLQEQGARQEQQGAVTLAQQAALGQAPSVAAMQLQRGLNAGLAQNTSMANSARGGGANLAAAQRAAVLGNAQLAGQTNEQAAQLRAGEMAQARAQYLQGTGQLRGQDQSREQLSGQMGQAQANAYLTNQGQNDTRSMGYENEGFNIGNAQLNAQQQQQQQQSENNTAAAKINSGVAGDNTTTRKQILGSISSAAGGSLGNNLNGGGGGGGQNAPSPSFASDIRNKTDIKPGDAAAEEAMDNRQAYTYAYNRPDLGKNPPAGIMAQDMEKSAAGRQAVIETPQGKAIDQKQALSLVLAENANLNKRLRGIEGAGAGQAASQLAYGSSAGSVAPKATPYELTPAQAAQFAKNDPRGMGPRLTPEEAAALQQGGALRYGGQ